MKVEGPVSPLYGVTRAGNNIFEPLLTNMLALDLIQTETQCFLLWRMEPLDLDVTVMRTL